MTMVLLMLSCAIAGFVVGRVSHQPKRSPESLTESLRQQARVVIQKARGLAGDGYYEYHREAVQHATWLLNEADRLDQAEAEKITQALKE